MTSNCALTSALKCAWRISYIISYSICYKNAAHFNAKLSQLHIKIKILTCYACLDPMYCSL